MLSFFWEPWFFFIVLQALLFISFLVQFYFIYPFINFSLTKKDFSTSSDTLSVLSINVHQNNNKYSALVDLIKKTDSDIVFTMETNKIWEENISEIESIYPYTKKVALENMYGMHVYSKRELLLSEVLFLKSDERPTMHLKIEMQKDRVLHFFWVHPPPPSPTEADTSKPKDTELAILWKKISKISNDVIVTWDFNSVAWSEWIKKFQALSQLKDGRRWRWLYPSCPAKFGSFAFPIDLLFHSKWVEVSKLETLENIGSDHLPIYFEIWVIPTKHS